MVRPEAVRSAGCRWHAARLSIRARSRPWASAASQAVLLAVAVVRRRGGAAPRCRRRQSTLMLSTAEVGHPFDGLLGGTFLRQFSWSPSTILRRMLHFRRQMRLVMISPTSSNAVGFTSRPRATSAARTYSSAACPPARERRYERGRPQRLFPGADVVCCRGRAARRAWLRSRSSERPRIVCCAAREVDCRFPDGHTADLDVPRGRDSSATLKLTYSQEFRTIRRCSIGPVCGSGSPSMSCDGRPKGTFSRGIGWLARRHVPRPLRKPLYTGFARYAGRRLVAPRPTAGRVRALRRFLHPSAAPPVRVRSPRGDDVVVSPVDGVIRRSASPRAAG